MPKHPVQPVVVLLNDDRPRFKQNSIVRHLLELCQKHGIAGMNTLADIHFDMDDRQHFAQLIGYTVDGYAELPYHYTRVVNIADDKVRILRARQRRRAKA